MWLKEYHGYPCKKQNTNKILLHIIIFDTEKDYLCDNNKITLRYIMLVFSGQFTTGGSTIRAKLEMYMFQEDGAYIVYCPALDLSAYGENEEDARKAFEQTFEMHFTYCINKRSLYDDLKKHGWTIKSKKQKKIKAPSFDKMLQTNDAFRDIARNKDYVKYSEEIGIPEFV